MNDLVSVILPVFNQEKEVGDSIESILNQTYPHIELIIIDDASKDKTLEVCRKYEEKDSRVIVLKNAQNQGLSFCVNKGVASAKGGYIARMDSDDISLEQRIEKQVNVFKVNPAIDVVGTGINIYNADGMFQGVKLKSSSQDKMIESIYKGPPFFHPTIMARKKFFIEVGGYSDFFKRAQDWELWSRTIYNYTFYNIQEPLVDYKMANGLTFRGIFYHVLVSLLVAYRSKQFFKGVFYTGFSTSVKIVRLLQRRINEKL